VVVRITDRKVDRQTGRPLNGWWLEIQTERWIDRQAVRRVVKNEDMKMDRQTGRQLVGWLERQTDMGIDRQTGS